MSRSTISLFNTNFIGLSNKKAELIQHLNNLHKCLKNLTQDEALVLQKVLKTSTAPQLLSHKILSHSDKDVKLLTCCCIVDVLRLMAPENPYNNEDTITAFNAVVNQLRGIATYAPVSDILESHVYYILNSIATVQSCVVPVMLAMEGVYGADEVAEALFSTILSSVRTDHPPEVLARSLEILQACIVESEGRNEELLEQLLLPLLPHNKTDNIAAYQVAATVLRDAWSTLENPVSSILNQILVGTSRESVGSSAEIADHVYSLVFELHRMAPALLNTVIPSICLQLQVEEEDVRLRAAMLLGQLFASSHAEYGVEFTRSFKDYLGRSCDISANIRLEVVNSCGFIVQNKPSLRKLIEAPLVQRLRDPDERLRQAALTRLIDLASAAPASLLHETYIEMAEKVKDKRPEVRRLAMVGLARIYNRHVSQHLPALTSVSAEGSSAAATYLRDSVDSDALERLQIIPGVLLQCWGYPEMSTRHLVIHLLQEVLLPKAASDSNSDVDETTTASSPSGTNTTSSRRSKTKSEKSSSDNTNDIDDRRASALLLIFEGLSVSERNALAAVLNFKAKARVELQAFLKIRSAPIRPSRNSEVLSRSSSSQSSESTGNNSEMSAEEHMKSLRKCMLKLMQTIPAADKKASYFENIYANKDRTVFRLLESCVSSSDSITQSLQRREDLKQRLVSKSALGEYMGIVFDVTSHMAANAGLVHSLLQYLEGVSISPDASACSDLLVLIAKYSAQAFQSSADAVAAWLSTCLNFEAGRGAKRELKTQLLSQCLTMINNVCASFEAKEAQHGLCTELIEHIKRVDHPDTCEKLAELVGQIAYYSNYDPSTPAGPCSVRATRTLITQLCSSKCLSQRNKRLDADLAVLGALCQIPKAAYVALNFTKPSFKALAEVIFGKIPSLVAFVKESILRGDFPEEEQPRPAATTAALALRAMTSALCTQEELRQIRRHKPTTSSSGASESASATSDVGLKDLKNLVVMLFDCIKASGGQLGGFATEDDGEKEVLFEAAADCALSMMKLHVFARSLTVDQWHTLGWTFLCPVPSIRQKLFNTLSLSIQTHPLHSKFLAYPCLFANDEILYPRAEQALGFAVQRRRRTHEELCSQALGQTGNQAQLQRLTEDLMPESILPYLLHLLSYHPDFPTSTAIETETDKRHMKNLVRSVSMLLQVLQDSLVNESCNMSYLLKVLNTANRYFVDKHDPDNVGLHFVTRMTVKLLHEQVKTSDNLQIHPGDVSLPADLYQRKMAVEEHTAAESSVAVVMLGAGTEEGFDEAELAIDRALHIAGKSNKPQRGGVSRAVIGAQSKTGGDHIVSRKRAAESPAEDRRHSRTSVGSSEKMAPAAVSRLPEEAPTRSLPKRGAKGAVVNYREPVESEREMLQWEAAASHSKKPRRSSELSLEPRTSLSAPVRISSGGDRGSTGGLSGWMAARATKPTTDRADTKPSIQRARMSSPTARTSAPSSEKSPLGKTQDSLDLLTEEIAVVDTTAVAGSSSKDHRKPYEDTTPSPEGVGSSSSSSSSKARALKSKTNILPESDEPVLATKKAKQNPASAQVAAAVSKATAVGRKRTQQTADTATASTKSKNAPREESDTVHTVRRSTRALRG